MSKRKRRPGGKALEGLPEVNPAAAGLDMGLAEIWACVPAGRAARPVQAFGTFTPDLEALAAWLVACQVKTVARESTGV